MNRILLSFFFCVSSFVLLARDVSRATTPTPRLGVKWWGPRHERKLAEIAQNKDFNVVFLGDSITHYWEENRHLSSWRKWTSDPTLKVLNLGFSGDRTENVVWRLQHGEMDGYSAGVVVLMIGTNNTGHLNESEEPASNVAAGVRAILDLIKEKQPQAKVVLCAILPRGKEKDLTAHVPQRNKAANALIRGFCDGKDVVWYDFGDRYLMEDGKVDPRLLPDLLHPSDAGYDIFGAAVMPEVRRLLGQKASVAGQGTDPRGASIAALWREAKCEQVPIEIVTGPAADASGRPPVRVDLRRRGGEALLSVSNVANAKVRVRIRLDGFNERMEDVDYVGKDYVRRWTYFTKGCAVLDLPPGESRMYRLRSAEESRTGFVRMRFNNPDALVPLSLGVWDTPNVYDEDGDGQLDILLRSRSVPITEYRLYRNPTPAGVKDPRPVFPCGQIVEASVFEGPSVPSEPHPAPPPRAAVPHFRPVTGGEWHYPDLDGDGRADAVLVLGDWTRYGRPGPRCVSAYGPDGTWTNRQIEAFAYWFKNLGEDAKGQVTWGKGRSLAPDGDDGVLVGPWGSTSLFKFIDMDGDGDIDFFCGEFVDSFWYFENVGTKTAPKFARGRKFRSTAGGTLAVDLCMYKVKYLDWDGDGRLDIIATDEDGATAFYRNTGRFEQGAPLFEPGHYFRQKADYLKFGIMPTPFAVDWDGDGDEDFIAGNSAGYIGYIENLSGPGVASPKWAAPVYLTANGKPIRTMAGLNGSPQGPAEQKWGYSKVSVADWDGDGFLDVMANDVNGDVLVYLNPGKRGSLALKPAEHVEVEWNGRQPQPPWEWRGDPGKALRAPWRTTPMMIDWNGDGLMDLVMMDSEGYLSLFERRRQDGRLVLLHPQHVFVNHVGTPLCRRLPADLRCGGNWGRWTFRFTDWDGDGKIDILQSGENATFLRQVGTKDGKILFCDLGRISERPLAGHNCSPTTVDFDGDGAPDYVGGAEDGHFYWLENPRSWERRLPAECVVLDGERTFAGDSRYLVPASARLVPYFGDFEISLEVKSDGPAACRQALFSGDYSSGHQGGLPEICLNPDGRHPDVAGFTLPPTNGLIGKTAVTDGKWHRIVLRRTGFRFVLSVDGRVEDERTLDAHLSPVCGWALGGSAHVRLQDVCRNFKGAIRKVAVKRPETK